MKHSISATVLIRPKAIKPPTLPGPSSVSQSVNRTNQLPQGQPSTLFIQSSRRPFGIRGFCLRIQIWTLMVKKALEVVCLFLVQDKRHHLEDTSVARCIHHIQATQTSSLQSNQPSKHYRLQVHHFLRLIIRFGRGGLHLAISLKTKPPSLVFRVP